MITLQDYERYGRQMIVPEMGKDAQIKIKNTKILVVGAGGLGSPAIAYLAGAGFGKIGIVDPDVVETSNLHRQIIHAQASVGTAKGESAKKFVLNLNDSVDVETYFTALSPLNAVEIMNNYDIVLDCTDSPVSRYLINDTAVVLKKPLVSASALKLEGQIAIYNYKNGPCYRCMFPVPPPPEAVTACGDGGILGPVVGIMGVFQAIEAIKVAADLVQDFTPSLTIFSALSFPPWRSMRIRGKKPSCIVCGDNPTVTLDNLGETDYQLFCGSINLDPIDDSLRISPADIPTGVQLVDVRPKVQFEMCHLDNSVQIELKALQKAKTLEELGLSDDPIITVCRYGNDSQTAVRHLQSIGHKNVKDIRGGLQAYSKNVDPKFPIY